jgi:hypothetical protein
MPKSPGADAQVHVGYQRYCCVCGRCWVARRKDACYCGPKCRQAAHRGSNAVLVRHKKPKEVAGEA